MITTEQRIEWTENPVTIELLDWIREELKELEGAQGLGSFHPFEPQRTQEILAGLNGARNSFEDVAARLSKDYYEDETDDARLE